MLLPLEPPDAVKLARKRVLQRDASDLACTYRCQLGGIPRPNVHVAS